MGDIRDRWDRSLIPPYRGIYAMDATIPHHHPLSYLCMHPTHTRIHPSSCIRSYLCTHAYHTHAYDASRPYPCIYPYLSHRALYPHLYPIPTHIPIPAYPPIWAPGHAPYASCAGASWEGPGWGSIDLDACRPPMMRICMLPLPAGHIEPPAHRAPLPVYPPYRAPGGEGHAGIPHQTIMPHDATQPLSG